MDFIILYQLAIGYLFLLRLGFVYLSLILIHEYAHMLAALLVLPLQHQNQQITYSGTKKQKHKGTQTSKKSFGSWREVLTPTNMKANMPCTTWLYLLLAFPLSIILRPNHRHQHQHQHSHPHVIIQTGLNPYQHRIVRLAAPIVSILTCLATIHLQWHLAYVLVAFIHMLDACASDIFLIHPNPHPHPSPHPSPSPNSHSHSRSDWHSNPNHANLMAFPCSTFYCGNFGALVYWPTSKIHQHLLPLIKHMVEITMLRGGQAGGIVTYEKDIWATEHAPGLASYHGVRVRKLNSKRGNLASLITDALQRKLTCKRVLASVLRLLRLEFLTDSFRNYTNTYHDHDHSFDDEILILNDTDETDATNAVTSQGIPSDAPSSTTSSSSSPPAPPPQPPTQTSSTSTSSSLVPSKSIDLQAKLVQGHTRFATSSVPLIRETHPHTWCPAQNKNIWSKSPRYGGFYTEQIRKVQNFVTHNGDFDYFNLFNQDVTISAFHKWLENVLRVKNAGKGDSINIAGAMDLLHTQGMLYESVRLAYCLYVLKSLDQAIPHKEISRIASLFEIELRDWNRVLQEKSVKPDVAYAGLDDTTLNLLIHSVGTTDILVLISRFQQVLQSNMPELNPRDANILAAQTTDYFFRNTPFKAMRMFLEYSKGSFGLALSTSLYPQKVVIAAKGQPMFIGWDTKNLDMIMYGSEVHALEAPHEWSSRRATHYYQLGDTHGEIMEMSVENYKSLPFREEEFILDSLERGCADSLIDSLRISIFAEDAPQTDPVEDCGCPTHKLIESCAAVTEPNPVIRMQHMRLKIFSCERMQYVSDVEFQRLSRLFDLTKKMKDHEHQTPDKDTKDSKHSQEDAENPLKAKLISNSRWCSSLWTRFKTSIFGVDIVAQDIQDIPNVIQGIEADWKSSKSENAGTRQGLRHMFAELAFEAAFHARKPRRGLQVLVVGVEVSLWVAEQFVADLTVAFPKLNAAAWSSNKILEALGTFRDSSGPIGFNHGALQNLPSQISPKAIVILITQSGVTFPTYHSAKILERIVPNRVFILTSDRSNLIAQVVNHRVDRIITNGCGQRPAEPSSVAVVAAHHTLSRILEMWMHDTFKAHGGKLDRPFGMAFNGTDLKTLAQVRSAFSRENTTNMCDPNTLTHKQLAKAGRHYGLHVIEPLWTIVASSLYIFITVGLTGSPVVQIVKHACGGSYDSLSTTCHANAQRYLPAIMDSIIYIFLPWWTAMLFRLVSGRDLRARLGKRTIVICDIPWVHQCLESYVTKLYALAYGWMSIDVHGANPNDHFVHKFTHRVVRGVLLAVGRPDGRLIALSKREAQTMLSVLQAKCIQNFKSGPDIVTVGHNPYKPGVLASDRAVIIPTKRKQFLCEKMLEIDPASFANHQEQLARKSTAAGGDEHQEDFGGPLTLTKRITSNLGSWDSGLNMAAVHNINTDVHELMSRQEKAFSWGQNQDHSSSQGMDPDDMFASDDDTSASHQGTLLRQRTLEGLGHTTNRMHLLAKQLGSISASHHKSNPEPVKVVPFETGDFLSNVENIASNGNGKVEQESTPIHASSKSSVGASVSLPSHQKSSSLQQQPYSVKFFMTDTIFQNGQGNQLAEQQSLNAQLEKLGAQKQAIAIASMARLETNIILITEGRYLSAERLVAFFVMFHAMARISSIWWPMHWNMAHSQSYLRVASTACPVSASDVSRILKADSDRKRKKTFVTDVDFMRSTHNNELGEWPDEQAKKVV